MQAEADRQEIQARIEEIVQLAIWSGVSLTLDERRCALLPITAHQHQGGAWKRRMDEFELDDRPLTLDFDQIGEIAF